MKEFLEIAKAVAVFGVKGEFRVQFFCDNANTLCSIKTLYDKTGLTSFKVKRAFPHKNTVVVSLDGVESVDQARAFLGKMFYAKRKDFRLKHGEFFIQDLVGMSVIDKDNGTIYGKITEILQNSNTDVYVVTDENGREILFPAIKSVIIDTNISKNEMLVRPLDGLLEVYLDETQKDED